jgi:hypothetical protein
MRDRSRGRGDVCGRWPSPCLRAEGWQAEDRGSTGGAEFAALRLAKGRTHGPLGAYVVTGNPSAYP